MNIIVYLWTYPPFRYTGGELMTSRLLEHLVSSGHSVDVYVDNLMDNMPYERNGVRVQSAAYLSRHMARQYDVFITHPEIRTGAIQHIPKRVPYIGIVHNTQSNTLRSLDRQPPALTVANSEDTLHHVPRSAKDVGVVVIHPPIDTTGEREGTPDHVGTSPRLPARHYVTAVNVSHEKGGAVLRYLAAQNPTVDFLGVIGGHGPQLIKEVPSNLLLVPPTGNMDTVYQATKVLVFPTKRESYGMVAAEAMQYGIPCIVSDLPALHEVCDTAAMYVDPHDYAAWNMALRMMLNPPVYADHQKLSSDRGQVLLGRSFADLNYWEMLVRRVAAGE